MPHNWSRAALAVGSLAIAGCASSPDSRVQDQPVGIPARWDAAGLYAEDDDLFRAQPTEALPADTGWVRDFDDPDLEALIRRAQARNYDLIAAAARFEQQLETAVITGADVYPAFNGSFGAARGRAVTQAETFGGGDTVISFTQNSFDLGAGVSWELDVWGRLRNLQAASVADAEGALADFQGARLSLAATTARLWYNAIAATEQLDLSSRTAENFRASERIISDRFEQGLSPALDLRLARANTAIAEAEVERRKRDLDGIRRELRVLLGDYPVGELAVGKTLPEELPSVPAGLPATLLERRPDLQRAERALAASGERVLAARKALLPSFSLTGSFGTSSDEIGDLVDPDFNVWNLAADLTTPIFQAGRLKASIRREEAIARERLATYGQTALEAFEEIESALAAEYFLADQVRFQQTAATESVAAEELAFERYGNGLTDIITVLESQQRAFTEQISLIDLRNLRLQNRIDLYLALGGPFLPEDPEAAPADVVEQANDAVLTLAIPTP
ncbi:MAG: efflux transporter outer membrane subunit [Opitutales bacterium]